MSAKSQKKRRKPGPVPRHGGYSLLTRGTLPERRKYIGHYLTSIREGLIHDLAASEEDLSTAQRVLIDRVVTFVGVVRLIEEHAREHGLLDSSGKLKSGIGTGHYLSFNRFIKEALALLGIERRELEPEMDLAEIVREIDEKSALEKAEREAVGQGRETGEGETDSGADVEGEGQGEDEDVEGETIRGDADGEGHDE
ncbi:MAG: hypothetical protein WBC70_14640 [Candidatus Aminicenantales bacterium]